MVSRREFIQAGLAGSALLAGTGLGSIGRLAAQQRLTEAELLRFDPVGNVTLIHVTDLHAQLVPIYFRNPRSTWGLVRSKGWCPT